MDGWLNDATVKLLKRRLWLWLVIKGKQRVMGWDGFSFVKC